MWSVHYEQWQQGRVMLSSNVHTNVLLAICQLRFHMTTYDQICGFCNLSESLHKVIQADVQISLVHFVALPGTLLPLALID